MAIPMPSIMSEIARHLSELVNTTVSGRPKVRIGPPADADPGDSNTEPIINLFIYRVEPSGFYPDASGNDPLYVRLYCLVTAYSSTTTIPGDNGDDTVVSAGEINLRLLGSVMQLFHENPVQRIVFQRANPVSGRDEEIRSDLQVVFKSLSSEEINQIWATQADTAYRASLAYELALAPITPWTARSDAAPVGSAQIDVTPIAALPNGGGGSAPGNGGPVMNPVSDPESALIETGGEQGLPPELVYADPVPRNRRVVRGWLENGNGGEPKFITEVDTVDLAFSPYEGLAGHMLSVFEKSGPDWVRIQNSAVADPGSGSASITLDVVRRPGEWMIYVESEIAVDGIPPPTLRSNIAALEVREVANPVIGGGAP
ncbi:MAG: DUF4255 domain-containing protein [bacterium]|nr:DUF4255 domain-containing protein [bacterium]